MSAQPRVCGLQGAQGLFSRHRLDLTLWLLDQSPSDQPLRSSVYYAPRLHIPAGLQIFLLASDAPKERSSNSVGTFVEQGNGIIM
jgi:hypothetical protein